MCIPGPIVEHFLPVMTIRFELRIVVALLACLFIVSLISPFVMIYETGYEEESKSPELVTSRKTLDVSESEKTLKDQYEDLKFQIEELQRIKVSVRNEMRELEKQRYNILQDTESYKSILYQLQSDIHQEKRELNLMQANLAKTSHELYTATAPPCVSSKPPPIYVLPDEGKPLPSFSNVDAGQKSYSILKADQLSICETDVSYCIDMTSCPLSHNLRFFVYSTFPAHLKFKYPELLQTFLSYLQDTYSLTKDPEEACLFLIIIGPFEETSPSEAAIEFEEIIYNLEYWGREGKNHVIINLPDLNGLRDSLDEFDPLKAIVVQSEPNRYWRRGYDIMIPFVSNVLTPQSVWKQLPPLVPAQRKYLMHFRGEMHDHNDIISDTLQKLANQITELVDVVLTCGKTGTSNMEQEISLCGSENERLDSLVQSTFSIVPITGKAGFIRLSEALQSGAIPVIIGGSLLPFGSVIDWKEAAIFIPMGRLNELHLVLRSVSNNRILELRRQGRFLWETYFISLSKVLENVVTVLQYRLSHLPPVADGIEGKLKEFGPELQVKSISPKFQYNSSVYSYRFWNSPPGPTLLYPHTPWDPTPISGSTYANMADSQLALLPPNIVQASGITGPFFESYLLGDRPDEYFTVVMLTYKREEVVMESIERLSDVKFLAKVIIVWNDVEKNPYDIEWPRLAVPLEVCNVLTCSGKLPL